MAYDLMVGPSSKYKDNPVIVGHIEFSQYPIICSLQKKYPCNFLNQLCDQFSDHTFTIAELKAAKNELYAVLTSKNISQDELNFIYKMIAVTVYALDSEQPLHGVAD